MQPFRTGPAAPTPCSQCGAGRADLLNASGDLVCKGCAMTGDANARLAHGRRSGKIGAVVGLVFGSCLILASLAWAAATFGGAGRAEMRVSVRIFAIMLGAGVVIVATCVRNLKRLSD
jgi:hypothetical protein